jgi:hypothetical protein
LPDKQHRSTLQCHLNYYNEEPCYDFVRDDGEAGKGNGPY